MPDTGRLPAMRSARLRRGAALAALAGVLAVLALVSIPVFRNIQDLATANSDNVQWTLAQVEVEYFSLKTALSQDVGTSVVDPGEMRRRFDVFYSRVGTVRQAQVFAPLREDVGFREALAEIQAFLDRAVPVIDAPDARLMVARRDLLEDVAALRPEVRALALGGIERFAELSDSRRQEVLNTLKLTAGLVLGLIGVLLVALVVLLQMFQDGARQARRLRQTTSRLDAIVSNSLAAIFVTDRNGHVLEYNGAAEEILGYAREAVLGEDLARWIVPDLPEDPHSAIMGQVLDQGRVRIKAQRKSGELFPAEVSVASVQSDAGEIYITFLRDVSEQVAADRALRKARDEAIAGEKAKADLLTVMSHEMRTPLNGLLGTLDLMGQTDLTPEQAGYVRNMLISGQLLLHHVGDVLDIARLEAGAVALNPADFDLTALLDELIESQRPYAQKRGNMLALDMGQKAGPVWLHGDAMRLRQILLNLVGNAIKFTEDGAITLRVASEAAEVAFSVTDTGIGIAPEDHARVFEDFVTLDASYGRQTDGTGLGLGITRRIVSAMGGDITVDSLQGQGTTFHVRLPMAQVAAPAPEPEQDVERGQAPALRSLDILLVEDNEINQSVAVALLERDGHRVTVASDGQEGVQAASARGFDLILMDISMPRMDGVAATQHIRGGAGPNAATRIVALTANALPEDEARFRAAGMEDVLTKPIRAQTLKQMLSRWQGEAPVVEKTAPLALDVNVLTELHGLLGAERVDRMLSAIDGQVAETSIALTDCTPKDAAPMVHKLAGAVALLGATGLTDQLRSAETDLKSGQRPLDADALAAMWQATRAQIGAQLAPDAERA